MNAQTTQISNVALSREEELREQLLVAKRKSGGDPSFLLDLLSELVERRPWEDEEMTFPQYVTTPFDDGGLGWTLDDVENLARFKHRYEVDGPRQSQKKVDEMAALRAALLDLLNPEALTPKQAGERGGRGRKGLDNVKTFDDGGNAASYAIRRLKRDAPELAEAVISGEMSANAAAIEAGFRTRTVSVPVDPERAARTLRKHFSDSELARLLDLLSQTA